MTTTAMISNYLRVDKQYSKPCFEIVFYEAIVIRVSGTRHSSEAEQCYFRLMNDPEQFEKDRYIDSINVYNSIIEQF
ncbi:MAG: hypothetical protein ACJ71G_04015, partial [Nitrososphaeraceae archaeon]